MTRWGWFPGRGGHTRPFPLPPTGDLCSFLPSAPSPSPAPLFPSPSRTPFLLGRAHTSSPSWAPHSPLLHLRGRAVCCLSWETGNVTGPRKCPPRSVLRHGPRCPGEIVSLDEAPSATGWGLFWGCRSGAKVRHIKDAVHKQCGVFSCPTGGGSSWSPLPIPGGSHDLRSGSPAPPLGLRRTCGHWSLPGIW